MEQLTFEIKDRESFQLAILYRFQSYKNLIFLNDNGKHMNHIAVSSSDKVKVGCFQFGFVSYDYKNQIEELNSIHPDYIGFPEKHLFTPQIHFVLLEQEVRVRFDSEKYTKEQIEEIIKQAIESSYSLSFDSEHLIQPKPRINKASYIENVEKLQQHIQLGDIYEVNYCQEFYAEGVDIDPIAMYSLLNKRSPAPFSCFVKHDESFLFCASPERYIRKKGPKLISQPIKGTIGRGKDEIQDLQLKEQLQNDPKERSENVMIVDLVRNDLSRVAHKDSVQVDELMGVYTFAQVHQLISTVSAEVDLSIGFDQVLRATFPMGSMTGAPKIRAMELIEEYEVSKRGLYSGTVGYITPENDFDFNVVIRSITYNAKNKYLSYMVGGAITALSDPEKEYEECLLKAKAMKEVLSGKSSS